MEQLPSISASFYFSGNEFDIYDVTEKMNIEPSKTREKKDFPLRDYAVTEWVLKTKKEGCKAVSFQIDKILNLLIGKEAIINGICEKYNVHTGFVVSIIMKKGDRPEMVLTKEIISFMASIKAEVGFDLYID